MSENIQISEETKVDKETDKSSENEKYEITIEIDCPPGAPRPDEYMKDICKDILKQEYHNPISTFFGEWDWKFEVLKSEADGIKEKIMDYLKSLYYKNCIRYGAVS
jgi:hypothetical protein